MSIINGYDWPRCPNCYTYLEYNGIRWQCPRCGFCSIAQDTRPIEKPVIDDILLQEIQSLKEKIKILTKIVSYYEPEFEMVGFIHDIGTCDFQEYTKLISNDNPAQMQEIRELREICTDIRCSGLSTTCPGNPNCQILIKILNQEVN